MSSASSQLQCITHTKQFFCQLKSDICLALKIMVDFFLRCALLSDDVDATGVLYLSKAISYSYAFHLYESDFVVVIIIIIIIFLCVCLRCSSFACVLLNARGKVKVRYRFRFEARERESERAFCACETRHIFINMPKGVTFCSISLLCYFIPLNFCRLLCFLLSLLSSHFVHLNVWLVFGFSLTFMILIFTNGTMNIYIHKCKRKDEDEKRREKKRALNERKTYRQIYHPLSIQQCNYQMYEKRVTLTHNE